MDQLLADLRPIVILSTVIYSLIGLALFGIAFLLMRQLMPFSVRKEIEEDQNIALAIIVGSVFISLAIIIQAAIH